MFGEASSSTSALPAEPKPDRQIAIPSSFLILPPTAAAMGMIIGMSRGGQRARLQFLAENAHRQPSTYQGWYFYQKTRNYRVMFQAVKTGSKYAAGLGAATLGYAVLEESVALARERYAGIYVQKLGGEGVRQRISWKEGGVHWTDGTVAGTMMGIIAGVTLRLPRPLFIQGIGLAAVMGGVEGWVEVARDRVGAMQSHEKSVQTVRTPLTGLPDHPVVDRPVEPSRPVATAMDAFAQPTLPEQSTWSKVKSWVPGMG